jgi:hypothetical protein
LRSNAAIDPDSNFALCPSCRDSCKLYSKTFCLKQLLISKDDLLPLKYLYNVDSKVKYYIDDDIERIIKVKFKAIEKNKERRLVKAKHSEMVKLERRRELIEKLSEYKLNYKPFGDCFTFVQYGYPKINTVIENEIKKSIELSLRKKLLYSELKKFNIPYREDSVCYDFINGITSKSLNDTITDAKIEDFFINYTNYEQLREVYPDEIAKEKALSNYMRDTSEPDRHEIANTLNDKDFTISID